MAVFYSGDPVNAVVADVGSYATKIGFAGEDNPRAYFRSVREGGKNKLKKGFIFVFWVLLFL